MKELSLNRQWQMRYCDIGTWTEQDVTGESIACRVPGAVHMALIDAGIIDEPLEKLNMEDCRFVEEKDFWHTVKFDVDADFCGDRVILTFEGVDVDADYYLNGKHLGGSFNAFRPAEFDVTDQLATGENTLTVRVSEGVEAIKKQGKSLEFMEHSWNKAEPWRGYLRKPQFCYGWDWARRLTTCGIYKPVYIRSYEKAYFEDFYVSSKLCGGRAEVTLHSEINAIKAGAYSVRYTVYTDENYGEKRVAASGTAKAGEAVSFTLEEPRLWWCSGYGEQYLYQVEAELVDDAGNVLDTRIPKHGVRSLCIVQEPIGDKGDKTFTFTLNGKPIYAKGANWVPVDQIIGRISQERYEKLIKCAVDMNMNMFRVWGGGFYESDAFFDLCDRLGMLVWHDFIFACGYYPDNDEEFVENVRLEAEYQVKNKRGRTCMVGWTGNNENYSMYEGQVKYMEPFPFYGKKIYEEVLAPICAKLDPDREFRLSSPFGGDCADDIREGDQHFWGTYHDFTDIYRDFFRIADSKGSFVSEFGMIAPMNLESLKKCCDEDQCYPQSEQWLFHSNEGDNFEDIISQYFSVEDPKREVPVDKYILMGQAIQAEVIRYAFEKYRSEKFLCSGALFWMYSDCYPTSGWCFVDYYYNKKPLYYYTKRAFAPVSVFFKGYQPNTLSGLKSYETQYRENKAELDILLTSDFLEDAELDCTVRVMRLDGHLLEEAQRRIVVPANSVGELGVFDLTAWVRSGNVNDLVVLCEVKKDGEIISENRYFPAPLGRLALRNTQVRCEKVQKDDCVELTISADDYVWLCHLPHDEGVTYDNNDFDLVPGKSVTVHVYGTTAEQYTFEYLSMNDCL